MAEGPLGARLCLFASATKVALICLIAARLNLYPAVCRLSLRHTCPLLQVFTSSEPTLAVVLRLVHSVACYGL
jgi:hypothetical protein